MLQKIYNKVTKIGDGLTSPFLLVVRLYWGWQFFITGRGKLQNISRTSEFFANLHIPLPVLNAYLVGTVEMVGGLALFLGLASRLASVPLLGVLTVAYLTAHFDAVRQIFSNPDAFTGEGAFLYMMACLIVLIFGPGKISLDNLLFKIRAK